jgi:hypothetical protein
MRRFLQDPSWDFGKDTRYDRRQGPSHASPATISRRSLANIVRAGQGLIAAGRQHDFRSPGIGSCNVDKLGT